MLFYKCLLSIDGQRFGLNPDDLIVSDYESDFDDSETDKTFTVTQVEMDKIESEDIVDEMDMTQSVIKQKKRKSKSAEGEELSVGKKALNENESIESVIKQKKAKINAS